MSLRRLRTYEDDRRYTAWLATHTTEWLEAFVVLLKRHPMYYHGRAVRDRINLVEDVLHDRATAAREAAEGASR